MTGRTRVLAATILGSSLAFIDGSVVNVALPAIQGSLGTGTAAMQWVMDAYLLPLGALVLLGGAMGDRLGRVRAFLAGVVLFTAASLACGLAPGTAWLVLGRAVQGVGAALLVPGSLAIIGAAIPDGERGAAIGTWSGAGALTTALGPLLGGWLVDAVSWRAIFLVNLPLAAAVLWLARGIPDSRGPAAAGPLDWPGAVLAAAGLGALTYGFIEAPGQWASARVLLCLTGGTASLAAFLAVEARQPAPMVPLRVFGSARFSGANVLTLLLYFALTGVLFQLPFLLIGTHGYSASAAGAALLPLSLLLGGLSRSAGRLAERVGPRLPLVAGPLLAAAGFLLLGLRAGDAGYWGGVLPGMLALAGGMTLAVAPLTTAVMAAAPDGQAGVASGINNAVARVAGLLAVSVLGILAADAGDAVAGFQHVAYAGAACAAAAAVTAAATIGPRAPA